VGFGGGGLLVPKMRFMVPGVRREHAQAGRQQTRAGEVGAVRASGRGEDERVTTQAHSNGSSQKDERVTQACL
jgi:orotidine-5'-phosphate decarboxylase